MYLKIKFLLSVLLFVSLVTAQSLASASSLTMEEINKLTASDGVATDKFGYSVAISGDTVVVGAYSDDSDTGSAYIYERDTTTGLFLQVAKLTASDGDVDDHFSVSVAIDGDTVVVGSYDHYEEVSGTYGSGSVYIYEKPITGWIDANESAKLRDVDAAGGDQFGNSVAISGDTIVVGATGDYGSKGSASIFERDTFTGLFQQVVKLIASDGEIGDIFGVSVAISGDTVVVGAGLDDAIFNDSGSAYIYEKNTTTGLFLQVAKLTALYPGAYDRMGYSVAINDDTVVVGAYEARGGDGAAYIYEKPFTGWVDATQTANLIASDDDGNSNFGYSVSISGDTVVVGASRDDAPNGDSNTGSAYIYEKPFTGSIDITQSAKLTASDAVPDAQFGYSVAISGDTVVVGALNDHNFVVNPGAAYVFKDKPNVVVNPAIIMYLLN